MVQSCSVYNCVERYKCGSNISFHVFPQDLLLKKQWVNAMHRENFKPSKHSRICSKHFTPDSFITNAWSSKKQLKCDSVPSIFDFPTHLVNTRTTTNHRKPPAITNVKVENVDTKETLTNNGTFRNVKVENVDTEETLTNNGTFRNVKVENVDTEETLTNNGTSIELSLEPPTKKRRIYYVGDFKEGCSSTKDQHYRLTVKKVLTNKNKQIKILQQRNRRLIKKVVNLKSLLKHLELQRMIDKRSSWKLSISDIHKK